MKEFNTVEQEVENLLRQYPVCRKSDKWLLVKYWQEVNGLPINVSCIDFDNWTAAETITRARRKIQEKIPELRADTDISVARAFKEEQVREHYGS